MPNDSSSSSSRYYTSGDGKSRVNAAATVPYLAALSPNASTNIDYDKLRAARVGAIMFFGGELYDSSHNRRPFYINSNLPELAEKCNSVGMPFGIYVNVRARTEIEADAECRSLYYVLAHYPPILGVWLALKTNNTKSTNDAILEVYYRYIDKWGLGQRCGLYLDKYQLKDISWSTFEDRYFLWCISPMDVSEIDDELLDPIMFEVD